YIAPAPANPVRTNGSLKRGSDPPRNAACNPPFQWKNRQTSNPDRGVRGYTTKRAGRAAYAANNGG
ncbi:hypothetical protein PG997_013711, partial [Apiospora hydei]